MSERARLGFLATIAAALALAACNAGGTVPTPINSAIPSVDLAAFCQGSTPTAQDLQAVAAAAVAGAAGAGFTLENAAPRIDSAISGLRGLSVSGDAATARDQLATALEKLKTEMPNPSVDTVRAAAQAASAFETAKASFCK